jgi:hypothetical protein
MIFPIYFLLKIDDEYDLKKIIGKLKQSVSKGEFDFDFFR